MLQIKHMEVQRKHSEPAAKAEQRTVYSLKKCGQGFHQQPKASSEADKKRAASVCGGRETTLLYLGPKFISRDW